MALLQLAESGYNHLAENLYLQESPIADNYIFIPAGMFGMDQDTYVRYDFFESLSDAEFDAAMITLAPYQPEGLSQIGAAITAATAVGKTVAPAIKKAFDKRQAAVASGTAKPLFKPGGPLSNLASKIKGGVDKLKNVPAEKVNEVIDKTTPITGSLEIGGTTVDFTTGQPEQESFFTKYKKPLLIGGGILVAAFVAKKAKLF